jgi:hypothetical protein
MCHLRKQKDNKAERKRDPRRIRVQDGTRQRRKATRKNAKSQKTERRVESAEADKYETAGKTSDVDKVCRKENKSKMVSLCL